VVSLLADGEVKLRFYVPEREVARYRPGRAVKFGCDSCGGLRNARITWVSPRPEFTPPIIYSRESRDRLVFRVEAAPDAPRTLHPGLPVDVMPLGAGA
jgi:HlyD family secretion protein